MDLLDGRVVRLRGGDFRRVTVYHHDPVAQAKALAEQGAPRLHVVDLNGARDGRPAHLELLRRVAAGCGVPVQFGGGLRDLQRIQQALEAGAASVIVGTRALDRRLVERALARFGPERVWVALDLREGRLAVAGWQQSSSVPVEQLARELAGLGVRVALVTDASRDGMLAGPNLEAAERVAACGLGVLVAGGVAGADDVLAVARRALSPSALPGRLAGVVVGRALYEGRVRLAEVLEQVRQLVG